MILLIQIHIYIIKRNRNKTQSYFQLRKCGQLMLVPTVEPQQQPTLWTYIRKLDIQIK
jgi:hypothetical protein